MVGDGGLWIADPRRGGHNELRSVEGEVEPWPSTSLMRSVFDAPTTWSKMPVVGAAVTASASRRKMRPAQCEAAIIARVQGMTEKHFNPKCDLWQVPYA